jgi:hypothetical protein
LDASGGRGRPEVRASGFWVVEAAELRQPAQENTVLPPKPIHFGH